MPHIVDHPLVSRLRFGVLVLSVQVAIIILFVIFVQYGDQANKDPADFFNKSYVAYDEVPNYYPRARMRVVQYCTELLTLHIYASHRMYCTVEVSLLGHGRSI